MTQDPSSYQPYDPYSAPPAMDGSQPPAPGGGYYAQQPGYGSGQYGYPNSQSPQNPYGAPGYGYTAPQGQPPQNGMGVAGLVLGIVAYPAACICLGWICAILAIVFGGIGVAKANKGEADNKGVAMAGLILGIGHFVLAILAWVLYMVGVMSMPGVYDGYY